jgi:hypothetical protein
MTCLKYPMRAATAKRPVRQAYTVEYQCFLGYASGINSAQSVVLRPVRKARSVTYPPAFPVRSVRGMVAVSTAMSTAI